MDSGYPWRKCEDPYRPLIAKTSSDAKKKTLREKSLEWRKKYEAAKRVERANIAKMTDWIKTRIAKVAKLSPDDMTTKDRITAAMRIAVLMPKEIVRALHLRLASGPGVFRTEAKGDSDEPAKIAFSRGVAMSHAQRHLLKMAGLYRDDMDTMAFLDWRAEVIDAVAKKAAGTSKVQQRVIGMDVAYFEGYKSAHIDLQAWIFMHFAGLHEHLRAELTKLFNENYHAGRKRVLNEIPVAENGNCGDAGKALLAELNILQSHGYDFTIFHQLTSQLANQTLPSTPEEWQQVNLASSHVVPVLVRKAWSNLMCKVERITVQVDLQKVAEEKAATKKQEAEEASKEASKKGHLYTEWDGGG